MPINPTKNLKNKKKKIQKKQILVNFLQQILILYCTDLKIMLKIKL